MDNEDIYKKVSEELGFPVETVKLAYESFWKFIHDKIEDMPLKNINSEEEFDSLRTSFNIPSIGKLLCRKKHFNKLKTTYKNFIKLYGRDSIEEDGSSYIQ